MEPTEGQSLLSTPPMSLRAYARHRHTSAPAVLRAIKSGRLLKSLVMVKGKAQIGDVALADREWAANTDLSRAPGFVKERRAPSEGETVTDGPVTPSGVTAPPRNTARRPALSPLAQASADEKQWKARQAELDYRKNASELMPAKEAVARWADIAVRLRSRLLGVPSKVKGRRPELTLDQVAAIDEEIRAALTELAEGSSLRQ